MSNSRPWWMRKSNVRIPNRGKAMSANKQRFSWRESLYSASLALAAGMVTS